jgi:hypothetical protein
MGSTKDKKSTGGELARTDEPASNEVAIFQREDRVQVIQQLRETFGGGVVLHRDLERVKNPTSGGHTFKVATLDGEEHVETLTGVIVAWRDARMYWSKPFGSGGKVPPDCSSSDGITGVGDPGGPCATCKYAQFGSKVGPGGQPTRGTACRQVRQLLMMRGSLLPDVINVTPGSMNQCISYMRRLLSFGMPYYHTITEISLAPAANADGIDYSQMRFRRMPENLTEEQKLTAREMYNIFQPALHTLEVSPADYQAG